MEFFHRKPQFQLPKYLIADTQFLKNVVHAISDSIHARINLALHLGLNARLDQRLAVPVDAGVGNSLQCAYVLNLLFQRCQVVGNQSIEYHGAGQGHRISCSLFYVR